MDWSNSNQHRPLFAEAKTLELATIDLSQSKYIHLMMCKAYLVQLVQNIFNQVGPTFMNTTNEIYSMLGTVDFLWTFMHFV